MQINSNKKLKQFFNNEFHKIRNSGNVNKKTSKYFGQIGSTEIEDINYSDQLKVKLESIKQIFQDIIPENILATYEIEASPEINEYRFRMDFVASYNPFHEPNNRFGQRKKGNFNWVVDMDECNLIRKKWFDKTRAVYEKLQELGLRNYDIVKKDGDLRYLVVREYKDQAMLNIVTATSDSRVSPAGTSAADFALSIGFTSAHWIINDTTRDDSEGEIKQTWGEDTMTIPLKVNDQEINLKTGAQNFFQNNIPAFEKILQFIDARTEGETSTSRLLYDLYSGVGTLGIAFAHKFKKVIGFEINESSVKLANENAKLNNVTNVSYTTQDLNQQWDSGVNPAVPSTLIVDPPRTGLQKQGIQHIKNLNPDVIIYISCNPITQAEDLTELTNNSVILSEVEGDFSKVKSNYKITTAKAFDLFPHTYHMENVVILNKIILQ